MADHEREPTQKTQPQGKDKRGRPHKPIDIPVPTREAVRDAFERLAKADDPKKTGDR